MLAGIHRRRRLLRVEVRRTFNHHGIELLLQQTFVAREASKPLGRRDVEFLARLIHPILKIIRRRNDVVASVLMEQVGNAPRTAPGWSMLKAKAEVPALAKKWRRVIDLSFSRLGEVGFMFWL